MRSSTIRGSQAKALQKEDSEGFFFLWYDDGIKKYKFSEEEASKFNKHGIDLTIYPYQEPSSTVCRISVKEGHFQEFYDVKSSFTYSIISGKGTFYLDGKPVEVQSGDLVVIPPNTKIYYFGKMEMVLTNAPAWKEENERHIRFVEKEESPYYKK